MPFVWEMYDVDAFSDMYCDITALVNAEFALPKGFGPEGPTADRHRCQAVGQWRKEVRWTHGF